MLDFTSFCEQYHSIFDKNNLQHLCTEEIISKFYAFTTLLIEENSHTNLTAIRETPDIIAKHYADCLLAESFFPKNASVMDVGCGGGFPTIPLAIARPDLSITAIDSTQKKINFVQKSTAALGLQNIIAVCTRAEATELRKHREQFDVVTSRAMARTSILTELILPFAKPEGVMIALKGAQGSTELQEAENAITLLGGKTELDKEISLATATETESRHILIIRKKKKSPDQYPRNYSLITKKPL